MKSSQRQTMKLQQKLSPQQLLLMQLVQLPVTALEQRIKEEIEKNPVLEDSPTVADAPEPLPDTDRDEPSDLNSNLLPVKAKGDVLLRSVLSLVK